MYKIEITNLANQDLDNIIMYIREQLFNITAAHSFLDEVEKVYDRLERNPEIYEICSNKKLNTLGYRRVVIKNYVMIYRVDCAKKVVYVLRVFYGRQDYEKLI